MNDFFASPQDDVRPPAIVERDRIRRLAHRQRISLFLLVGMVLIVVVAGADYYEFLRLTEFLRAIGMAVAVLICLASGFTTWLLARELLATWQAAGLSLAAATPLVGVFALLGLSHVTNRRLRQEGIRVGLLGADPGQIH